ncbi:MAG TPA: hypothetical protein PLE19_07945 [Planctomycetota bacterium]|nr:hypothetical protein [Planctomycetota bacterium]HRR81988.1 hypothetical protein [Planctomycetota bacterium]HRT97102.1 hypothetical protein [Planctomycetota bacterium]
MSVMLTQDSVKKWLTCLGCGKRMWTDRCHRICKKCRRRNDATPDRPAHGLSLPRSCDLVTMGIYEREQW